MHQQMPLSIYSLLLTYCLILFPFGAVRAANAPQTMPILCYSDVLADYYEFVRGKSVLNITDYRGKKSRRDVVEIVIIQQALALGGYKRPIEFQTMHEITYKRTLNMIATGEYISLCNTNWNTIVKGIKGIKTTSIVIPARKFVVGLFIPENSRINITNLESARRYKIVCNPNWLQDQIAIDAMQLNCVNARDWQTMIKMLIKGRGDFILAPFQSTRGGYLEAYGSRLKPIPNIKARLSDDRVFLTSENHPDSKNFYQALEKGLAILRQSGRLEKAYTDSGFYNTETKNWPLLNP